MNKFTNKSWFLGIDISKETLDVSLINQSDSKIFMDKKINNTLDGFEKMNRWLSKKHISIKDCLICMEHTGVYGLLLIIWLHQQDVAFCVESGLQIKKSLGIARGKNDKIDARRIAIYAMEKKDKLKPFVLPAENLMEIKQLLTYRDQLVRLRTSFKNSLKSHIEYKKIISSDYVTSDITKQIESLDESIDQTEKQIIATIKSDKELNKNFSLATSVKGIGLVIAAFMLVSTNNFTGFENGRKFACYSGIAPFPYESGESIKKQTKVSNYSNKKLKSLLSNGANSAKRHDPEIRAYYKRKTKEGKDHKLVINAISCKLVNRVFAVVKRQSPYVSLYQQKFA